MTATTERRRAHGRSGRCASWLAGLALSATLTVILTGVAHADAPVQQGWWWAAQNDALPAPVPTPPDVPADGLLVQGGPQSPLAIAAVVFVYDPAVIPSQVVVHLAPSSASTPNAALTACPVPDGSILAQQGGSMTSAPAYDCKTKTIAGALATDGTSYSFDVRGLGANGTLAVVLLPGSTTDRVVLAHPDQNALTLDGAGVTPSTAQPSASRPEVPPPSSPHASAAAALPPLSGSPGETPGRVPEPAVLPRATPSSPASPAAGSPATNAALTVDTARRSSHPSVAIVLLLVASGTAALLWNHAARPAREPAAANPENHGDPPSASDA